MAYDFEASASELVHYGDVFDSIIGGADKKFSIGLTLTAESFGTLNMLLSKVSDAGAGGVANQEQFWFGSRDVGGSIYFLLSYMASGAQYRHIRGGTALSTGVRYRAVATYDGSVDSAAADRVKLYVNGALETNTLAASAGAFPFDIRSNGSAKWTAAALYNASGFYYSDGVLSDCALWSGLLSAADAAAYGRGTPARRIRPDILEWDVSFLSSSRCRRASSTATEINTPALVSHPRRVAARRRAGAC